MLSFFLSLLIALPANPARADQQYLKSATFCGEDNTDPANTIPSCSCQNCLNVESSVLGNSVRKRHGFINTASLSVSSSMVNGSLYYVDQNGNNVIIACQDLNCEKSVNNAAFSLFVTTASAIPRYWSLAASNGLAYGANDQQDEVWILTNGVLTYSTSSVTGIPRGKLIDFSKDRMIVANTSAKPNGVYYSKSGDPTTWVTGVNSVDPWVDSIQTAGQQITGLKNWNGSEYIFQGQSITDCQLGDQYTTSCNLISPSIGTNDPGSIILTSEGIMFKASDGNFWLIHPDDTLENKSLRIRNLLNTSASGSQYSNTQTSQADWNAGTQSPSGSWSTTQNVGAIVPSTITLTALGINTTDWAMVDVDTTVSVTNYVSNSDGSGLDSIWTSCNRVANSNHFMTNQDGQSNVSTAVIQSTGEWSFVFRSTYTGATLGLAFNFVENNSLNSQNCVGDFGTKGYALRVDPINSGNNFLSGGIALTKPGVFLTTAAFNAFDGNNHTFLITRSTNGYMEAYADGIKYLNWTDLSQAISTNSYTVIAFDSNAGQEFVSSVKLPLFYQNQTSKAYDTTYASPIYGTYNVSMSSVSTSSVTFNTQTSNSSSSGYSSMASVTNGGTISSPASRYLRHQVIMWPPFSAPAASVSFEQASAASSGTFVTQCINTSGMSNSYGLLNCAIITGGSGSLVLSSTSTASCSSIPSGPNGTWTTVTNNTAPSISTNTATWIRAVSSLSAPTDQADLDACTLNWTNGTQAPPVFGIYNPIDNSALWSFSINQSSFNARVLKYDMNLDAFYPFSLNATSMLIFNGDEYFGGSNGGYWNKYPIISPVDSDNGQAINSYFQTKDYNCSDPFQEGQFQSFSMVMTNEAQNGTVTNTYTLGNGITGSYSVNTSTDSTKAYVRSNKFLPINSQVSFMNFQIGNNAANQPWELLGYEIACDKKPWRVLNP